MTTIPFVLILITATLPAATGSSGSVCGEQTSESLCHSAACLWCSNATNNGHCVKEEPLCDKCICTMGEESEPFGNTIIGAVIQVFLADLLIVLGLGLQKLALMRKAEQREGGLICCNSSWLIGICVFAAGQISELAALSFTSSVNITAMSTLKLPWNALVARQLFGERFTLRPVNSGWRFFIEWDAFTYVVMIVGAVVVVLCSPPQPPDDDFTSDTLIKMWIELPFVVFGTFMLTAMLVSIVWVFYFIRNGGTGNRGAFVIGNLAALTSACSLTSVRHTCGISARAPQLTEKQKC